MAVYLMEDHELPLVGGTMLIRTGDRLEPANKVGLAQVMGTVMRSGGTQSRSADEINAFLEQRAAAVETGVGETSGSASFSALTEDLEDVFRVFADIIREPAFPVDKIDLAKTQVKGGSLVAMTIPTVLLVESSTNWFTAAIVPTPAQPSILRWITFLVLISPAFMSSTTIPTPCCWELWAISTVRKCER